MYSKCVGDLWPKTEGHMTCTCVPMITASETGVYIVLLYTELRIISNQAYYLSLWREQSL